MRPDTKRVMLEEIKNYRRIHENLALAGQPSADQLDEIRQAGFEVVINLGLENQSYSLPDEKARVEKMGLAYFHIPVVFETPSEKDYRQFVRNMEDQTGRKIFVHCAANFRASCFAALYGRAKLGWSQQKADEVVQSVWNPNTVWQSFLQTMEAKGA